MQLRLAALLHPSSSSDHHAAVLTGARLTVARAAWAALMAVLLAARFFTLPLRWTDLLKSVPLSEMLLLYQVGIPLEAYAGFLFGLELLVAVIYLVTAALIFLAKSNDGMALLVSASLAAFGNAVFPLTQAAGWEWINTTLLAFGLSATVLALFLFPTGRFVPSWSRWLLAGFGLWLGALVLLPSSAGSTDIESWSPALQSVATFIGWMVSIRVDVDLLQRIQNAVRNVSLLTVLLGWFGSGLAFQVYRYRRFATQPERQQTKSIIFGFALALLAALFFYLPPLVIPVIRQPGIEHLTYQASSQLLYSVFLALVPIFLLIAVLRYRLWAVDLLINRTLVYGALTGLLGALYFGSVFVLQMLVQRITGQNSDVVVVIATLATAALVRPLRSRIQDFIDRRFYREKVDFRAAFTEFGRELRTQIDLAELQNALVHSVVDLLHIEYAAIFQRAAGGAFTCEYSLGMHSDQPCGLPAKREVFERLEAGSIAYKPGLTEFPMLVPLLAPRAGGSDLVGILALGPRRSGERYTREDQALLLGLADQAGTALRVAQLVGEKRAEAEQREEIERQLTAHWNSPLGRAEACAQRMTSHPEGALQEMHRLANRADADPDTASLVGNLPKALGGYGAGGLGKLAEGYAYLYASHDAPEMLAVGLRSILACLQQADSPLPENETAVALGAYASALDALQVRSVADIAGWQAPSDDGAAGADFLAPLRTMLGGLRTAADALRAYERVDASQDKLAYLAGAIERLGIVHHSARTDLGAADRPIVRRIAEHWMAVVTGAMGELQSRAQIGCELLTRHTWQGDVVVLALQLRNTGRGAALGVEVRLLESPDYLAVDPAVTLERLGAAEEAQVELRVRPKLAGGANRFRAAFEIRFTDPRGADQRESFADVVYLLQAASEFQTIPNPYVVGTPLQAGSPLFFGREDVLAFIRENLAAAHRNNLVLIGQRRTGKSSLLKQLPARLGGEYLTVYLDGQALGLDPGLPAFFFAIATEIAYALEDSGLTLPALEFAAYQESPARQFEKVFLPAVREAAGGKHLLLLLDEFEELESATRRGTLDASVFAFLRHLIQHTDGLSVIFCGTHRLEELASDYWSVLFNISLYRHIGFLSRADALRLVEEPVAAGGMRFDDLALDKIWRVTAGHPYFLQLICHNLVNQHNRNRRSYVTVADVNAALEEILTAGEAHFLYVWTDSAPEQKLALFAQSRMGVAGPVSPVQMEAYLAERGVVVPRARLLEALRGLVVRDILSPAGGLDAERGESFLWKLGLLGMWVEKSKSLGQVVTETAGPRTQPRPRAEQADAGV